MTTLVLDDETLRVESVRCDDMHLTVTLKDGRTIATPLRWYPRLLSATPAQRANYEIMPLGVHWPDVDEDLSVAGMLRGEGGLGGEPV